MDELEQELRLFLKEVGALAPTFVPKTNADWKSWRPPRPRLLP